MVIKLIKQTLPLLAIGMMLCFAGCKSDVDSKKQQKAFYVDAEGNLLNKKGDLVKKKGEYKMEGGFYVDSNGEYIQRKIDKTKEKINKKVDNAKDKMADAKGKAKDKMAGAKDKVKNAASNTKKTLSLAANRSKETVTSSFNELFNTKAVGTIYPLSEIKFNPESHKIVDFKKEDVEGLAASLKDHPASRIQVQVYTADAKTKGKNKEISNMRAELVANMLVALGVKKDQISSKGMGLPTADAAKAVANAVEIVVEQ